MTTGINYEQYSDDFLMQYYNRYGATAPQAQQARVAETSIFSAEQLAENKCTDGCDDGKIGFFSKIGNALEGVWDMGKNLFENIIKHPFKTAAMIGVCCIPVVGPAIGAGLAAYGLFQGGKQIVNAWQASENATTDAEAKAAWENIGSGLGTTALSAVGLKGSVGALRGQLAGGSTTVSTLKGMKGAPKGELVKTAVSDGLRETGSNFGNFVSGTCKVAKAGVEKVGKGLGKAADFVDDIRVNGFKNVGPKAQTAWNNAVNSAGKLAEGAYNKAANFFKGFTKKGKAELYAKQVKNGSRIEIAQNGKPVNKAIKWNSKTKVYELKVGNKTITYDKTGLKLSEVTQVGGRTTTVNYRNGAKSGTTTKWDSTGTVQYRSAKGGLKYTTGKNHLPKRIETRFGSYRAKGSGVKDPGFSIKGSKTEAILNATSPKLDAFYDGTMGTNDFLMYMSILDDIE